MSYPENILKIFGHPQEILENILWPWRNTRKYCNFFFFSKMYILVDKSITVSKDSRSEKVSLFYYLLSSPDSTMYEFRPKPPKNHAQNMIKYILFDHLWLRSTTWKPQISWCIFWNHFGIIRNMQFLMKFLALACLKVRKSYDSARFG